MFYEAPRGEWVKMLCGCLKILGVAFFAIFGLGLVVSAHWYVLGIPMLMYAFWQIIKKDGPAVAYCPYCGSRIKTAGAWVVYCRVCRQRSNIRQEILLRG